MLLARARWPSVVHQRATAAVTRARCTLRAAAAARPDRRRAFAVTAAMEGKRVAVIGAGAAGLAAARELLRAGHAPAVLEQAAAAGGVWVYSDATDADPLGSRDPLGRAHSSMYLELRTNLPRELMSFTELPFTPAAMAAAGVHTSDGRRFPSHAEVLAYLRAYAAHYDLERHVRFGVRVTKASPIGGAAASPGDGNDDDAPVTAESGPRWAVTMEVEDPSTGQKRVETEVRRADLVGLFGCAGRWLRVGSPGNDESIYASSSSTNTKCTPQEFDALCVCNGHYSATNLPEVAGADCFPGLQMHSHNYRSAGWAVSHARSPPQLPTPINAANIRAQLITPHHTNEHTRTPAPFAGRTVLVVGASNSGEDLCREIAAVAARVVICARAWKNAAWGRDDAPFGPRGNIERRGMVARLGAGGRAEFERGAAVDNVDCVIYATGYRYEFPFFEGEVVEPSSVCAANGSSNGSSSSSSKAAAADKVAAVNGSNDDAPSVAAARRLSTAAGHVSPLYRHMFFPRLAPTLVFIGVSNAFDCGWRLAVCLCWCLCAPACCPSRLIFLCPDTTLTDKATHTTQTASSPGRSFLFPSLSCRRASSRACWPVKHHFPAAARCGATSTRFTGGCGRRGCPPGGPT
jgi:hypothetical protein